MVEQRRADARRNYEQILAAAADEVASKGAAASLEHIARSVGLGSATVRRHFPTRRALLEAVSHTRIDALAALADELGNSPDARCALLTWLREVTSYCVSARGLAVTLSMGTITDDPVRNSCAATLETAARPLLRRAADQGCISPDLKAEDVVALTVGIALACEHHPRPEQRANELLDLVVQGLIVR